MTTNTPQPGTTKQHKTLCEITMDYQLLNKDVSFSEVTILLSQTVFSLLVANHITKTSETVPLLGRQSFTIHGIIAHASDAIDD